MKQESPPWIRDEADSVLYWEYRYRRDGVVGAGSLDCWRDIKIQSLDRLFAERPFQSLLDVGFGDMVYMPKTRFFQQCAQGGTFRYFGIDGARNMVSAAQAKAWGNSVLFQEMKLTSLLETHLNEEFDVIVCYDVLFHLVEDSLYTGLLDWLFRSPAQYLAISYLAGVTASRSDESGHYVMRDFMSYSVPPSWRVLWEASYPPKPWLRLALFAHDRRQGGGEAS